MIEKDFDRWNERKKQTHRQETPVIFYEREVWWCVAGANVGVEIDGKHDLFLRPVIVIRKFNKDMALVLPTTDQDKSNRYYFKVVGEDGKQYNACLSQIKAISSKRLFRKIGTVGKQDYGQLLGRLVGMIIGSL